MEVEITRPRNGWVDFVIRHENFVLSDAISDVPCDFVGEMVSGFRKLLTTGGQQQFLLGLEPHYYEIIMAEAKCYFSIKIELVFEHPETKAPELIFETGGTFSEIILPFFHAIKKFYGDLNDPMDWDWPSCNQCNLDELTLIIERKSD